jgi:hypothetical protein
MKLRLINAFIFADFVFDSVKPIFAPAFGRLTLILILAVSACDMFLGPAGLLLFGLILLGSGTGWKWTSFEARLMVRGTGG